MDRQMTMQRMTELLRAEDTSRSRRKLRGAFTRILQLTRDSIQLKTCWHENVWVLALDSQKKEKWATMTCHRIKI